MRKTPATPYSPALLRRPTPIRGRRNSLLLGTAVSAIVGLGYGRGAYGQTVISEDQKATLTYTDPLDLPLDLIIDDNVSVETETGDGIEVKTSENGDISITTGEGSTVASSAGSGMYIYREGEGILSITTGQNSAVRGVVGIYARHDGDGDITVTTGSNSSFEADLESILIYRKDAGIGAITISTGENSSISSTFGSGIRAFTYGSGDLVISTGADSTIITTGDGIGAGHEGVGDLIVTTGDRSRIETSLSSGANGIGFLRFTSGDILASTGAYSSINSTGSAVRVLHFDQGNISITTGANSNIVQAGRSGFDSNGIYAYHFRFGDGNIDIMTGVSTNISAETNGIAAIIDQTEGNISITTGVNSSVSGGDRGIYAKHDGTGNINITTDANSSVSGGDYGIYAKHEGIGDISITTGANSRVIGGLSGSQRTHGIYALQEAEGDVEISLSAGSSVSGSGASSSYALRVFHKNVGDISITSAGDISLTGYSGLDARSVGVGSISVDVSGDIFATGTYGNGISASTAGSGSTVSGVTRVGGDVDVQFHGNISANYVGIFGAALRGSISVDVSGAVRANGNFGYGITARGSNYSIAMGTEILITTAVGSDIMGARKGLNIYNYVDDTTITIGASTTISGGNDGIFVNHRNTSVATATGNITITTGANSSVSGGDRGIYAKHEGTGDINITTDANSAVSGGDYGIFVKHYGLGGVRITTGDESILTNNTYGSGVQVERGNFSNRTASGDIDISTGTRSLIEGGFKGIYTPHWGDGNISITTGSNSVIDVDGFGIETALSGDGHVGVTVGGSSEVSGGFGGVRARVVGDGSVSVTTDAGSTVRGGSLYKYNYFGVISAGLEGDGTISLDINGTVLAEAGQFQRPAIYSYHRGNGDITITVGRSGSVFAISEDSVAISASARSGDITLSNSGVITGRIDPSYDFYGDPPNAWLFTNIGTWNTTGTSNFNAIGSSLVVNEGLIVAATGAAGEITTLSNLDVFRNSGGTIRLADGVAGDEFRVSGNFVADGGVIELDVNLSGLNSSADKLVIGGDVLLEASGPTNLRLSTVRSGTGEPASEVLVVDVTGRSTPGSFVLANTDLGAFVYNLSLGDCSAASGLSWYLCSTGQVGSTAALFEALPSVLLGTFGEQDSLAARTQQRLSTSTAVPRAEAQSDYAVGPWLRVFGDYAEVTPNGSTSGVSWTARNGGLHFGIDEVVSSLDSGTLIAGAFLRYGTVGANIRNDAGTGRLDAEGYGIGATLTWYGDTGFYADIAASLDRVSTDAHTSGSGTVLNGQTNHVYTVSGEIGHRFSLENGMALVPQAQLTWSSVTNRDFSDALGNPTSLGSGEIVIGRVGMAMEHSISNTGSGDVKLYGFGNLLHDFSGNRSVTYAGTNLTQSGTSTWGEIGAGVSVVSNDGFNIYAQGAYRDAFSGVSGHGLSGSVGLQMRW